MDTGEIGVMHAQDDESQKRTELRLAFLRHLPGRTEQLARRARRFCRDGWDINGLSLLQQDLQRLAGASGRYGELEASEQLHALDTLLAGFLANEALPDAAAGEQVQALLERLSPALAAGAPPAAAMAAGTAPVPAGGDAGSEHFDAAPPQYWRRWVGDAPPPEHPAGPAADAGAVGEDDASDIAVAATVATSTVAATPRKPAASPARAPAPVAAAAPAWRIYHLTDADGLALELDQRLESLGFELELLETSAELMEILGALAPDLVLVGASFQHELEEIGGVLRATRERTGARLPLLALASEDTVPLRLAARRAGADALLINPKSVDDVVARVRELLDPDREAAFRILIVEDDRAQGLFAESILRNAGMEPLVVDDAFQVLDTMQRFAPDLVLMDLYMPGCDGTELTALIREREEFLHTPIVFLSGESDQEKHFAALDAGGDDFLAKPIRPKYLIAAVNNRVRRARALQKRAERHDPRDPGTGLYDRAFALDRINEALGADNVRDAPGGVLFVEIDGAAQLRDRLGLSVTEQVFADVASLVQAELGGHGIAARFGDGGFVLVCTALDDARLDALATGLRAAIAGHAFSAGNRALRLRGSIGICAFRHGFADAAALLNAAERSTREARAHDTGVHRFEPPRRAEQELESALITLLRDAVEGDAFELLYQPIVAVQGGEQAQYQTLVRLRDDAGRLHLAAEIVPLAERADLIVDLDRWVLTQALRVIEQRHAEHRPVRLFVSQSPQTLGMRDQGDWLAGQVEARKLPNGTLILELRADEVGGQLASVHAFCAAMVPHGVQFCLSNFELDAEREQLLEQLPVDFVKLAPKYLRAADAQAVRDELRSAVDAAHRRGIEVIAQRVEDAQAAATLWMSGIDFIQGNLVQQAGRALEFDFQAAVL